LNIQNIKAGDTFKNYKQLCQALNEKVKSGKAKILQVSEFERYFSYTRKGYTYIIDEIFDTPKPKLTNEIEYIEDIEKLILDLLIQQNKSNGLVFLSKSRLMQELKMININYTHCKFKTKRLSALLNISKEEIEDFYLSSDSLLLRNLETALNNLKDRFLISWKNVLTISVLETDIETNEHFNIRGYKETTIDEYGEEVTTYDAAKPVSRIIHRKASVEEDQYVTRIQRNIAQKYNCENVHELYKANKTDTFYKEVKDILLFDRNITGFYYSYEIIFNEDHIQEIWENIEKLKLKTEDVKTSQTKLNEGITKRLNQNALKRHERAKENQSKDIHNIRMNKDYIQNNNTLTQTLINKESFDIRKIVDKVSKK
jgi:hypothetical protein